MRAQPECIVRAQAQEALARGEEVPRRLAEAAVCTVCTFKECGAGTTMHAECFAKLEATVIKQYESKSQWRDLKPSERTKALCTAAETRTQGSFAVAPLRERRSSR